MNQIKYNSFNNSLKNPPHIEEEYGNLLFEYWESILREPNDDHIINTCKKLYNL